MLGSFLPDRGGANVNVASIVRNYANRLSDPSRTDTIKRYRAFRIAA